MAQKPRSGRPEALPLPPPAPPPAPRQRPQAATQPPAMREQDVVPRYGRGSEQEPVRDLMLREEPGPAIVGPYRGGALPGTYDGRNPVRLARGGVAVNRSGRMRKGW